MGNFADFVDLIRTVSANRKVRKASGDTKTFRFRRPSSEAMEFPKAVLATVLGLICLVSVMLVFSDGEFSLWTRLVAAAVAWSSGMGCSALFHSFPDSPRSGGRGEDRQGFPDRD